MSEELSNEELLAKSKEVQAQAKDLVAAYEAEYGPIRKFKDLKSLFEEATVGEGRHEKLGHGGPGVGRGLCFIPSMARFYCFGDDCGKPMDFFLLSAETPLTNGAISIKYNTVHSLTLNFRCGYCGRIHSILLRIEPPASENSESWWVLKAGEWPSNITPLPESLINAVGKAKDLLLKGYEAETLGMGIGALSYYRRVLVYKYQDLLKEILKVAKEDKTSPEILAQLNKAIETTQFKTALDESKDCLPASLTIGVDPLHIIHKHVSSDMHHLSDYECLKTAALLRSTLSVLTNRIDAAKQDTLGMKKALAEHHSALQKAQRAKAMRLAAANGDTPNEENPGTTI